MKKRKLSIVLEPEMVEALRYAAEQRGTSISQQIAEIVSADETLEVVIHAIIHERRKTVQ